jgi:hypothetical protein
MGEGVGVAEFQKCHKKMLLEKIDVTAFMTWFINSYPKSVEIMKENPDYQYRFRSTDYADYTDLRIEELGIRK